MNEHRKKIKKNLKKVIDQFKDHSIDFNNFISTITANIGSLDNLDHSVESAARRLCGELEIIHYTVDSDKEHDAMIEEVKRFEKFIEKI